MRETAQTLLNADAASLARAVIRWWFGELSALIPRRLMDGLAGPKTVVVLALSGSEVSVGRLEHGRTTPFGRFAAEDRAAIRTAVAVAKQDRSEAMITLRLAPERVLYRQVELPLTATRHLRPLLGFELDRQTPLSVDQAYFDYRVIDRAPAEKRMTVELAVARRIDVTQAVEAARDWGLDVNSVDAPPRGVGDWRVELLPARPISTAVHRRRQLLIGLAILVALLGGALLWQAEAAREATAVAMQARLQQARSEAAAIQILRHETEALAVRLAFLPAKRRKADPAGALEEVARLLPDDCWLTSFVMDGASIRIQGIAVNAAQLVATIDGSPLFADAHFTAPLVKAQVAGAERFDLTFSRKAGVAP